MAETSPSYATMVVYLVADEAIESFSARYDADHAIIAARDAVRAWFDASRALDARASAGEDVSMERTALGPAPSMPPLPNDRNYVLTRDSRDVRIAPGATPVAFHIRRLTVTEGADVKRLPPGFDQALAAFARGLVRVDGLPTADGGRRTWSRPTDGSGKQKPIPHDMIDAAFDLYTIEEIGGVVMHRSFFSRTPSAQLLPLPDISHAALQASLLLRAGQTRASSNSAAISAPAKDSSSGAVPLPSQPSEPPTSATAQEDTETASPQHGPQGGST